MEMADGIVINKADGNNIERAKLAQAQFRNALHLFPLPRRDGRPRCSPIRATMSWALPRCGI
jgi:LAO/AO transport system kinase